MRGTALPTSDFAPYARHLCDGTDQADEQSGGQFTTVMNMDIEMTELGLKTDSVVTRDLDNHN